MHNVYRCGGRYCDSYRTRLSKTVEQGEVELFDRVFLFKYVTDLTLLNKLDDCLSAVRCVGFFK